MTLSTRQATNTFNMALAIGNNQQRFTFRMIGAARRADRIRITAEWVTAKFEQFYDEFLEVPH